MSLGKWWKLRICLRAKVEKQKPLVMFKESEYSIRVKGWPGCFSSGFMKERERESERSVLLLVPLFIGSLCLFRRERCNQLSIDPSMDRAIGGSYTLRSSINH